MANSQTADWRLRETINKRIERQIREGYQPLTRYKTLFPFTEGGDIIDRRTGKVKNVNRFVAEYVNKQIGTQAAFVAKMGKYGVPKTTAKQAYASHKAERLAEAKAAYSKRLHVLAGMDITRTGAVRMHYRTQTDAIFQLYLSRLAGSPGYDEAKQKIDSLSDTEKAEALRVAKRRSTPGGHYTLSFYEMLGEYLDIEYAPQHTP